jgi:hypothetical protein
MKKITKKRYDLVDATIYREKSDCSYWKIVEFNDCSGCYTGIQLDDEGNTTDQTGFFTPHDLINDYIV